MTTTSPKGRTRTPRSRAAMQTRQPVASAGGKDSRVVLFRTSSSPTMRPLLPDFSNPRMISGKARTGALQEKRLAGVRRLQDRLLFKDPQARHGGGATDGVPGEGMPVKERFVTITGVVKGVVDPVGGNRGRQWKIPAGDAFPQRHDVGHHAFQVTGEHLACPSEAGCTFNRDEQDIVVVA